MDINEGLMTHLIDSVSSSSDLPWNDGDRAGREVVGGGLVMVLPGGDPCVFVIRESGRHIALISWHIQGFSHRGVDTGK